MIQRFSHSTLYVTDQDAARDFYVNKLGFDLRMDQEAGGFRWLTVGPKGQPEFQLILMKIGANSGNDEKTSAQMRDLLTSGKLGAAGVFETADCRKTYDELSA
jgi:catechol 2,3-dioxygenase-like lactoylglutathione lyase family enzyme